MSFEQADFDRHARFDSRVLGSVGNIPHTNTGPESIGSLRRPQLSLVPDRPEIHAVAPTDPEAFFPEKGGSTREAKRICLGCEVRDACLDYALAHDERFGIWGGLSERERRRLKRGII